MDPVVARWLDRDPDPATRQALLQMIEQGATADVAALFAGRLAFGTAGLRGILGPGPTRMNRLVVRETTAGLGRYLLGELGQAAQRGVVIGFDGRTNSRVFAEDAAQVLAGLGIAAHLFEHEVPTPVCAFAVRHWRAAAGIVVTASHNPPEYNGYKVYWENGAQIIPPQDIGIAQAIEIAASTELPWLALADARTSGLVRTLGAETCAAYLAALGGLSLHPRTSGRRSFVIAYTPLHGVGAPTALAALERAGFEQVHTVAAQQKPDARFPTVRFPNPEEPGAMDAVLALAREVRADIACANDPDADRLAVAVREPDGSYRQLTGDQLGALLGADCLRAGPANAAVVTTIVSSRLLGEMARARGAVCVETLTGFKWIAQAASVLEAQGRRFVFGYEEALGYAIGDRVRDKDGISALVAVAELGVACAERGQTLLDELAAIYRKHGLFLTAQRSLALAPQTPNVGAALRAAPPRTIGGFAVRAFDDLQKRERTYADGQREPLALPPSDVLTYWLANDARIIVRPSGTEPKLKCYYEWRAPIGAGEPLAEAEVRGGQDLQALIDAHQSVIAVR